MDFDLKKFGKKLKIERIKNDLSQEMLGGAYWLNACGKSGGFDTYNIIN